MDTQTTDNVVIIVHTKLTPEDNGPTLKRKVRFTLTDEDREKLARLKKRTIISTEQLNAEPPKTEPEPLMVIPGETDKTAKLYKCFLCEKQFNDRSNYWKHINNTKRACVSSAKVAEILEKSKCQETKISKQNEEISKLSELVTKLQPNVTINGDYNQIFNNNNTYQQMLDLDFQFTLPENERLDHISDQRMLGIVNNPDFNTVLKELVAAVYFDHLAPQNWRWCVNDKDAQYGAMEYDSESHRIATRMTSTVINNHIRNVIDRVVEVVEGLQKVHEFNSVQNRNTTKLFGLIGVELSPAQLKCVRERAYAARNIVKPFWTNYNISAVPIDVKIKSI